MSRTLNDPGEEHDQPAAQISAKLPTLGWALKRAAFGLILLVVLVSLGAWLFDSGIDPNEAAAAGTSEGNVAAP